MNRGKFLACATMAAASHLFSDFGRANAKREREIALFNGKTLEGWIQIENSAIAFSGNDISDPAGLASSILNGSNGVAAFLNSALDDVAKAALTRSASPNADDVKALRSQLAKDLNRVITGPLLFDKARFEGVHLRPETRKLLHQNPTGRRLVELNRMLLADAFPADLAPVSPGWTVKEGAMASTGSGRGVIYTVQDFQRFRLTFTMRHVSGSPDHQACVLIFCARPPWNEIPLDALGGIQFQVPRGGHWDYRPGHNTAGGDEFTTVAGAAFDPHEWSRVEIVADASAGIARMAVAQPVGSKATEVLDFRDPSAGRIGPIALQMHNAGLFDEYKNLTIDTDPATLDLITTK
jgi:hypothetical protein